MAADDNLQQDQFGPDVYKAARMAMLYQRNLRQTSVDSVATAQDGKKQ